MNTLFNRQIELESEIKQLEKGLKELKDMQEINVKLLLQLLESNDANLHIMLPNGDYVPDHFHITEVGKLHKSFVDCGGTKRETTSGILQVWVANDKEHRLRSGKLAKIIKSAMDLLSDELLVEIEYETDHVAQYPITGLEIVPDNILFLTGKKHTACLALDKCGITGCC